MLVGVGFGRASGRGVLLELPRYVALAVVGPPPLGWRYILRCEGPRPFSVSLALFSALICRFRVSISSRDGKRTFFDSRSLSSRQHSRKGLESMRSECAIMREDASGTVLGGHSPVPEE
jgi:hypothetical protein